MVRKKSGKFILAALGLILAVIWISPFYIILTNSFKTKIEIFTNTMGLPKKFIFSNYSTAMQDLNLSESFTTSLLLVIASLAIIVIFTSMAAYALQRVKRKMSTVIFMLFTAAMLIPFQAVMIPLVAWFGRMSMLNVPGLIIMYLGFGSSLGIFLYHGALKGVPRSLDEAALIDGCSRFRTFWSIIFPLLKPTTITVMVLDIMWIWNDYLLPSLVINNPGTRTLPLMIFLFFGEYTKQWHLAMAGITIAILPVVLFYFFAQKQIIAGVMSGAVKQ